MEAQQATHPLLRKPAAGRWTCISLCVHLSFTVMYWWGCGIVYQVIFFWSTVLSKYFFIVFFWLHKKSLYRADFYFHTFVLFHLPFLKPNCEGKLSAHCIVAYLLFFPFSFQDEQIELGKQELSVNEIQQKVKEYNAQISNNLYMVDVRNWKEHFHWDSVKQKMCIFI